jgi:hypothetical protein
VQVEDDVSAAVRGMGHHLSAAASALLRRRTKALPLPQHLRGLHPLAAGVAREDKGLQPGAIAPGVFDRDHLHEVCCACVQSAGRCLARDLCGLLPPAAATAHQRVGCPRTTHCTAHNR